MTSFIFTWNNPKESNEDDLMLFRQVTYLVYQVERGASGTVHLQGYMEFSRRQDMNRIIKSLKGIYLEPRMGSQAQAIAYCTKEETRVRGPYEYGTPRADKIEIQDFAKLAIEGRRWEEVCEMAPRFGLMYAKSYQALRAAKVKPRSEKPTVLWLYGETGAGKTRFAYQNYPEAYWKMPDNKWWDGYNQEEDVIIDDIRADTFSFAFLLRLLDRYPLKVEVKGGVQEFVAKNICITCPKRPEELFAEVREDIGQLMRRIDSCHVFHANCFECIGE